MTPTEQDDIRAPWMKLMRARIGWTEFDHDKQISKDWHLAGLNYHTVIGATHAWCALAVNIALYYSGYRNNGRADAVSFEHYGTETIYQYGAIIPIRHVSGSHHVTFFHHWIDEDNKIAACLGGNQDNSYKISAYNLSGNRHGHDQCVGGPRWPVKI